MEPSERRLEALEESLTKLVDRVARLERMLPPLLAREQPVIRRRETPPPAPAAPSPDPPRAPETPPPPPPAEPAPPEPVPARPPEPRRSLADVDLEALLGGRVLAWVGGIAIVIGAVLFLVMAVSRGWIDEPTRVVLAFIGSSALLAVGVYLYERRGRTEAAIAAVASAIAALYAALTAATLLYDLISPVLGLGIAGLVGATATAIAVRWNLWFVAALGIVGALLAPVLVEADTSLVALAFMAVALVSATAVLLWQRWDWLAIAAYVVSVPQLVAWLDDNYEDRLALALIVVALFWVVYAVAAIGYELRVVTERLRPTSASLLVADGLLLAGAGYFMLDALDHDEAATGWVIGSAVLHVALGSVSLRGRMSREIAVLLLAVAVGLAAVATALALDGPALVAGWAVESVLLAWVARRSGYRRGYLASAVLLALATGYAIATDASPDLLADEGFHGAATVAAVVVALAAALVERLDDGTIGDARVALRGLAALGAAYAVPLALDGVWVTLAWAALALAAAFVAARLWPQEAPAVNLGFLALATGHTLVFDAAPDALRNGVEHLGAASLAVAAVGVAALGSARLLRREEPRDVDADERGPLGSVAFPREVAAAVAAVYLPSVAIVDLTVTGEPLEPGQTPQVLLSTFWSLAGLAAVVYGLVRDDIRFRIGGLVLLGVAVAKVFLYDLGALDEIFRVLSFVVLGLLLLAGAYAYARLRRSARAR